MSEYTQEEIDEIFSCLYKVEVLENTLLLYENAKISERGIDYIALLYDTIQHIMNLGSKIEVDRVDEYEIKRMKTTIIKEVKRGFKRATGIPVSRVSKDLTL